MRKLIVYLTVITLFLASCSHKKADETATNIDSLPMMIMQIQKCSKLYTAEYRLHKIITHDDQLKLQGTLLQKDFCINLPLGDRKIAIPVDATLKAYIDFGNFSEKNVKRAGNKIEIILPDPKVELTSSHIDHDAVRKHVSLMRSNFSDTELSDYEKQGRATIIASIPRIGIIDKAKENAARTLIPMIEQLGYKEQNVTITFRKDFDPNNIYSLLDKTTIENEKKD
jgi:hypothetical protein